MGKVRKAPPARPGRRPGARPPDPEPDPEWDDAAPGRIHGATITSWNGPPTVDLAELFARAPAGVSVGGSSRSSPPAPSNTAAPRQTVCLSDGTEITFVATDRFSVTETA